MFRSFPVVWASVLVILVSLTGCGNGASPQPVPPGTNGDVAATDLARREADVERRESAVQRRELNADKREADIQKREAAVSQRELNADQREADLQRREAALQRHQGN